MNASMQLLFGLLEYLSLSWLHEDVQCHHHQSNRVFSLGMNLVLRKDHAKFIDSCGGDHLY